MVSELFQYFRTRVPGSVKKLGYVYSSIALERRARRQKASWSTHIAQCHSLWKKILSKKKYKKIALLGSGPLTEVPVAFILDHCEELHLFDIVQPIGVRRLYDSHPQVTLHEVDLAGVVDWIKSPKALNFEPAKPSIQADLVVSANLLSQLSLEPSWYLNKKFVMKFDDPFMLRLIQKIGDDHLKHLQGYGAKQIVVYTDVERSYVSPSGEVLETQPSRVPGKEKLGEPIQSWKWQLCPLGEDSKEYEIQMAVQAFDLTRPH